VTASAEAILESLDDWWALAGIEVPPRPRLQAAPSVNAPKPAPVFRAQAKAATPIADAVSMAKAAAAACTSLDELEAAVRAFDGCSLKAQARNTVFMDGVRGARVMVIGEAPGKEEDEQGRPFVGASGQLLDRMLASIGLNRSANVAITNIIPWRPPGNRNPTATETAICLPFVRRHIEITQPDCLLLVGAVATQALLDSKDGIMKMRKANHRLTLPNLTKPIDTFVLLHPAFLLRRPQDKHLAWADLLRVEKQILLQGVALEPHF